MPDPRTIAKQKNTKSDFDGSSEDYDAVAGLPPGIAPQGKERDYAVNVSNPPEKPAPAKNLHR